MKKNKYNFPILFVIGLSGSGKSEFLKVEYKKPLIRLDWGNCIKEHLQNYPINRIKYCEYVNNLKNIYGNDYYSNIILKKIIPFYDKIETIKGIVVCGARNLHDINNLTPYFNKVHCYLIISDITIRYKRYLLNKHQKKDYDELSFKNFIQNDLLEYKNGLAELCYEFIENIYVNNKSLEKYHNYIKKTYIDLF